MGALRSDLNASCERLQLESPAIDAQGSSVSDYELSREERIKENRERMQKFGILDLSQKLTALRSVKKRTYRKPVPSTSAGPVRRSSRLQSSTPVSYCEAPRVKNVVDKAFPKGKLLREEGQKPEIYSEEHKKLLGSTDRIWKLFVDGYGKDGKRIYDPIHGKTCHQCRQKTLGLHTRCCNCSLVQGQFCGDCLYMRYGENVLEVNENPNWICPVCRGICNCSLCRQEKGWPATGTLYRKVSSLGYKSVAHYLIETRRCAMNSDENVGTKVSASAKRSLPFSDETCSNKLSLGDETEPSKIPAVAFQSNQQPEYPLQNDKLKRIAPENNENEEQKIQVTESETAEINNEGTTTSDSDLVETPKTMTKRVHVEAPTDSIASRLRQRRMAS